jgi:peptide deformylase
MVNLKVELEILTRVRALVLRLSIHLEEELVQAIVKYGDPVLGRRADEVSKFDESLAALVAEMFDVMYAAGGVGLAAPQIGISMRIFVMDASAGQEAEKRVTVVNPTIELADGDQDGAEGCLSVPGFSFDIRRPDHVIVRGQDASGSPVSIDVTGLEARCVSHEVDHLDGRLLLAHISPLKRDITVRKIKKRMRSGDW